MITAARSSRALPLVVAAALVASACSGGGGGGEQVDAGAAPTTDGSGATTSTTGPTTTAAVTTIAPGDGAADAAAADRRARQRARQERLMAYAQRWREGQKEHAEQQAAKPPPPPSPPPAAPPPAPAPAAPPPPPPPTDAERFAPMCQIAESTGFLDLIVEMTALAEANPTDDLLEALRSLPPYLDPMLDFYDAARPVAPKDLDHLLPVVDPFVAELRTTLLDLEAIGVVAGDEPWFDAVITAVLGHPEAMPAILSIMATTDFYCS